MSDIEYIKRTLQLAKRAYGMTNPNPMVGAVLVKDGKVISEDYHRKPGTPHAEALVIEKAGPLAKGATLYVNLEPCCHSKKRTPPCTDAIIKAGIKRVVAAMVDPNPQVSGRGFKILGEAGIEVSYGILEEEARRLNEVYIKHITTGLPFVTIKVAMTLDGKIALPDGQSKWITSERSRRAVHRMRAASDAILTGIGTVLHDDPEITARLKGAKSPIRIVIDPELKIPEDAKILKTPPPTIIVTKSISEKAERFKKRGIELIFYKNELSFYDLFKSLAGRGISSLMVEAGSTLPSYILKERLVDKVVFFIAPKIFGGKDSYPAIGGVAVNSIEEAYRLKDLRVRRLGDDILITGYLT